MKQKDLPVPRIKLSVPDDGEVHHWDLSVYEQQDGAYVIFIDGWQGYKRFDGGQIRCAADDPLLRNILAAVHDVIKNRELPAQARTPPGIRERSIEPSC